MNQAGSKISVVRQSRYRHPHLRKQSNSVAEQRLLVRSVIRQKQNPIGSRVRRKPHPCRRRGDLSMDWFNQKDRSQLHPGAASVDKAFGDDFAGQVSRGKCPAALQPVPFSDIFHARRTSIRTAFKPGGRSALHDGDARLALASRTSGDTPVASQPPAASLDSEESLAR